MSTPSANRDAAAAEQAKRALLGTAGRRRWPARAGVWLAVAALLAVGAGGLWWRHGRAAKAVPEYVSQPIRQGDITLTVLANGTLQPTRLVSIGSELSGTVSRVLADVNDRVKKGQVLMELDTTKLESQVERSRASLAAARAGLAQAQATVAESRADLQRLEEVQRLSGGKVPSASELDTGRATLQRAVATQASAAASVKDAQAALASDETNLSKASIVSPIDGVVLTRAVEPGYAVAATLQAVTLFTLAEDLSQLRLDVNVDEADVGRVKQGQKANFTVSAWPGRGYPATVSRVAYGSTTTDSVVTYTTRLNVDNADLSLRPGMTAAATIVATERKNVLLAPNAALRFAPVQGAGPDGGKDKDGGSLIGRLVPRQPDSLVKKPSDQYPELPAGQRRIWIDEGGRARPIVVRTGISDGRNTEISGEALKPGMLVITDQRAAPVK